MWYLEGAAKSSESFTSSTIAKELVTSKSVRMEEKRARVGGACAEVRKVRAGVQDLALVPGAPH